jgi:hypothetical protein
MWKGEVIYEKKRAPGRKPQEKATSRTGWRKSTTDRTGNQLLCDKGHKHLQTDFTVMLMRLSAKRK